MPRRRRKAPGVGSTPASDRPTTPVADTLGSRRYATRSATKGQQKRVRAPSDSSTGSSSSADQLEHEQALQKVRSLDTVKKALKSALGDIQKLSETAHAAGDGSDDSETSLQEEEDIAHKRLKALRASVVEAVDRGVAEITDAMQGSLQRLASDIKTTVATAQQSLDKEARAVLRRRRMFSEKRFQARTSVLSTMLADKDFQTMYNIAVASLVWLGLSVVFEEVSSGSLPDMSMMMWAFSRTNVVIVAWWSMFLTSFLVVWLVQYVHHSQAPMKVWVVLYVGIQCLLVGIGIYAALHFQLPPASGFIVMCESVRMFMKVHGYMREKLLHGNGPNEYRTFIPDFARRAGVTVQDLALPHITIADTQTEVERYMYYMFCPSLVYRDSFPRTRRVRWAKVLAHMVNVAASVIATFVIFRAFCTPHFQQAANAPQSLHTFARSVFYSMVPSMTVFVLAFFGVLHSWFNLWAELLRYADREFYTDWWNARSFGAYYRKWNIVVHEWLYYYLYLDTIRFSKGRFGKGGATTMVFVVSALFHEWIIFGAIRFWYPVLLLMFGGPGVIFMQLQKKSEARFFNIFMWMMLSVGMGLLLVLYSREWYARFGDHNYQFNDVTFAAPGSFSHFVVPQSLPSSFYASPLLKWLLP